MTFIATPLNSQSLSVNLACWPQFDAEPINAATIAPLITPRTKALSVVHLGGWPADMPTILELPWAHGIAVVEDCAEAHGARIHGQSVGSFADVAAWSFCQDKILTTAGEGGMVTTHRADLWDAIWACKDHGKTLRRLSGANIPRLPLAARALLLRGAAATAPTSASANCRASSAASSCSACPSGLLPEPAAA